MNYKKAVATYAQNSISAINNLDEIMTTFDYEQIRNYKFENTAKGESAGSVIKDTGIYEVVNANEYRLFMLLEEMRQKFYFQGLMCKMTTMDIFDIILKSCSFELDEEESYQNNSDEEINIS